MSQRIVDLSLTFTAGMRGVTYEQNTTIADTGYNTTNLHIYSHAGTHMDAPLHFVNRGRTIDHLDLNKCVGPALVVDLSHMQPNAIIGIEDLTAVAGKITQGSRLLMRTDWDLHADLDDYRSHMPRVSTELAAWLVDKGIVLLGLETPSVASLRPENLAELTEVHQIFLNAEVVIVESLANLRDLRQASVDFIALPLKIDGCDGSPTRAVAIESF